MRKYIGLILGLCLGMLLAGCDRPDPEQQWLQFVAKQVQLGYSSFSQQAKTLQNQIHTDCEGAHLSAQSSIKLQEQWRHTMVAWQSIQWVRFGPIAEGNLDWKIQFWPDKKNLVARKIQQFLNDKNDNDVIKSQDIASASVVIQGVSALEFLLFDTAAPKGEQYCQLLGAVGENLAQTAAKLENAWLQQSFVDDWLKAPQVNAPQGNAKQDVFDGVLAQVERIKLDKLGEPLGLKTRNKKPNGYFAESWRSEYSLQNIRQNVAALRGLMVSEDQFDLLDFLSSQDKSAIADELLRQLDAYEKSLNQIQQPLRSAVTDDVARNQVQALHQQTAQFTSFLKSELAPALNVTLGFNANDGD